MLQLTTVFLLISGSILAVVHILALELFLYWRYWWFDIPMHVLGGVVVALGIFTLYDFLPKLPRQYLSLIPIISSVLIIALVWEVYQLLIGIPIEADYEVDTIIDLIMGTLGGVIGYLVATQVRILK